MPKPTTRRPLTGKGIAALKPVPGKRPAAFDAVVPGLAVRVTERGAESFVIIARFQGRQRWVTLGPVGVLGLAEARDMAREALARIRRGEDPAARQMAQPIDTVATVVARFIEEYARPHTRSWRETDRIFNIYVLPSWATRDIGAVARRDVRELLEVIASGRGGVMSNRVLSAVRKLFGWSLERDIVSLNPAAGVRPLARETSRDRVLSDAELRAFWAATGELAGVWGPFLRMLALTGQRLSEVAGVRWDDIDLDLALWTLPAALNKSGRLHEVPLSDPAVEILRGVPRWPGPFVFTTTAGRKPVSGFAAVKRTLDAAMPGVAAWRLHDVRRAFATTAARLGIAPHVVEKCLNHSGGTIRGVAAVYNQCGYDAEKRAALSAWARHLTAEKPSTNVVNLR